MYPCLSPGAVGISLPWRDCLPLAKQSHFAGIDLPIDPQISAAQYTAALQQYGLQPGGMGLTYHVSHDDNRVSEALAALPAICQRAREVGQTRFYTWILSFSDSLPFKENFRLHVQRLAPAARILAEHGCRLGLEFLGPKTIRDGHRYPFIRTMEGMLELADAVGPNAGLLLDAYHWYTSLGALSELGSLDNSQVVYVHINDAPAGVPIEKQLDQVRCLPGDSGVIDLPGFLQGLADIGYDGPVVAEPFLAELAQLPPEVTARRVGEAIQRVWPKG